MDDDGTVAAAAAAEAATAAAVLVCRGHDGLGATGGGRAFPMFLLLLLLFSQMNDEPFVDISVGTESCFVAWFGRT